MKKWRNEEKEDKNLTIEDQREDSIEKTNWNFGKIISSINLAQNPSISARIKLTWNLKEYIVNNVTPNKHTVHTICVLDIKVIGKIIQVSQ
jgi:hypothetical protein